MTYDLMGNLTENDKALAAVAPPRGHSRKEFRLMVEQHGGLIEKVQMTRLLAAGVLEMKRQGKEELFSQGPRWPEYRERYLEKTQRKFADQLRSEQWWTKELDKFWPSADIHKL